MLFRSATTKLTFSSLPNIKLKVKRHLDKIIQQLSSLPELPANVELEVQTSLMEFVEVARSKLRDSEFTKRFSTLPDRFRDCLLEMKPKFNCRDKTDIPVLTISDDESDSAPVNTTTTPSKRRNGGPPPATPSKRQRTNPTPTPSFNGYIKPEEGGGGSVPPMPVPATRPKFLEPFTRFSDVGRGFRTLRQVREEIKAKTRAGMPDLIPDEVYKDLCREAVQPWDGPMKVFLDHIMRLLQDMLESALKTAFQRLERRLVYPESRKHLRRYLEERRKGTEQALALVYRLETYGLFTINNEAFARCKEDEHITLKRYRHLMRMQAAGLSDGKNMVPWESLTEEKRVQDEKRREAEIAKIGPDSFEREVAVVAYVRGYYRLAALRFADSVALHITNGMIPEIERYLPFYLDNKLGLRGSDAASVYERLMAEDEATAAKRETLKREKDKFVKALSSIEGLEAGTSSNGIPRQDQESDDMTQEAALDEEA